MYLSFPEHMIELRTWETKAEMIGALSQCEVGNLLLGEDVEREVGFHSAFVHLEQRDARRFGVGICSEGHGLFPHLLLKPDNGTLLFGFNQEVVGVAVPEARVRFRVPCGSLFYSFLQLNQWQMILVFSELGVTAITDVGQTLWSFSRDIVVDWMLVEDRLQLSFVDRPSVSIALQTGSVLE